jgi:membrane dipeptidase
VDTVQLPAEQEKRAQELHREAFVFDACLAATNIEEEPYLSETVSGGLDGALVTTLTWMDDFQGAIGKMARIERMIAASNDRLTLCTTVDDLLQAKKTRQIGILHHFQDTKPIADNLGYLKVFYQLGLRVLQLTYNVQNWVGSGCCERHDGPLSEFGVRVVEECNRLGILIDCTHCGEATTRDALRYSKAPVVFTHANPRALANAHFRNKTDEEIRQVADSGGVIGITATPHCVKRHPTTHEVLPATLDDLVDHVDYVVRLVGVDYVGFGGDMEIRARDKGTVQEGSSTGIYRQMRPDVFGVGPTDRKDPLAVGFDRLSKRQNLTTALVRRGYNGDEVKKILGGNWLRVFSDVWRG